MKARTLMLATGAAAVLAILLQIGLAPKAEAEQRPISVSSPDGYTRAALEATSLRNATMINASPVPTTYLPLVVKPWPAYQWLVQQQDKTTGLLPGQQDTSSFLYVDALAVEAFTLEGDDARAKTILDYFNGRASEFFKGQCNGFDLACSTSAPCDSAHPCGFFQDRNSRTGVLNQTSDRWIGDMAWLAIAIHYYQTRTGDATYAPMAQAVVRLLKDFQQPAGYIASGWVDGDQKFDPIGYAEGNLNAYKALSLYGETLAAQQVKHWLDYTDHNWEKGPLDVHSWRALAMGNTYGFSLPDTERTDNATLRYKSTITYSRTNAPVTGFLPVTASEYGTQCGMSENIWTEGTGQMAVALYRAGYRALGDYYVGELEKLLFTPTGFPGTQAIPFMALPDPVCHSWADLNKGQVAAVSWYIFAKERFDPYDGVVMSFFQPVNPVVQIEAENYGTTVSSGIRLDGTGEIFEGKAMHIGGDDNVSGDHTGWAQYQFNVLVPITVTSVAIRYADDVGGDIGTISFDGNPIANLTTVRTGTGPDPVWGSYILADVPIGSLQIEPGLHTFRLDVIDNGTWGFTVDDFQILLP